VSSELERRLRDAREALPTPEADSTERARERAVAAIARRKSRRARTAALVAAAVVVALLGVGFAGASFLRQPFTTYKPTTSRIVDRTFVCAHGALGDLPEIETRAGLGIREGRSRWKQLPYAIVATGRSTNAFTQWGSLTYAYAWITAGSPSAATRIDPPYARDLQRRELPVPATIGVNAKACKRSNARVPLSQAGLSGGAASPFGDELDCSTQRRFLIRVRAVLDSPTSLRARDSFLATKVPVREAKLAARTLNGKALVYAETFDSGKTRLFTANACVPE